MALTIPFAAIIAVDWSGAADERSQRAKIWSCLARPEGPRLVVDELRGGWTRGALAGWLVEQAAEEPALLVGLDFPFSYPAWFAGHVGRDWQDLAVWCQRYGREAALLGQGHGAFWGAPGSHKPRDREVFRRCEEAIRREPPYGAQPKSAFQIAGPGAPGMGVLAGIPFLHELRLAGFAIWPFDRPGPGQPVAVEIYSRLFYGRLRKSRRAERAAHLDRIRERLGDRVPAPEAVWEHARDSDDAFDALVAAIGMGEEATRPGRGFDRYGDAFYEDPAVALEGWIWGLSY